MPKIFTPENRNDIRKELLECGFGLLKQGGLAAVNIDTITEMCFIAKGTFYNFFKSKSDYMYQMALYERKRAKEMLIGYLKSPKESINWKCACNLMKLLAFSLSSKNHFIAAAYDEMNMVIIEQIVQCLVEK